MSTLIRTYSDLSKLATFKERYDYLRIAGIVGEKTFGSSRFMNQEFYKSKAWRSVRDKVIVRDNGCDLGVYGYELYKHIIIHHMNPISIEDIETGNPDILDPEFLICVSENTHNAIHYGDETLLPQKIVVRRPGDTWF